MNEWISEQKQAPFVFSYLPESPKVLVEIDFTPQP